MNSIQNHLDAMEHHKKEFMKAIKQRDHSSAAHHSIQFNKHQEIARKMQIKEDGIGMVGGSPTMPANIVSGGDIAGLGVGPQGEPGVNKKKKITPFMSFIRRKAPK